MRRPHLLRLVALAGAVVLAGAAVGGSAIPGAAATTVPRITLVGQDAFTPLSGDLHAQLKVDGAGPGFSVSFVVHQALTRRTAFEQSLSGSSLGSVLDQVVVPLDSLPTDTAGNRDVVLGLEAANAPRVADRLGARRAGVYPLEVDLHDADDQSRSRFVTYLVVSAPAGSTGALATPLGVAWVWPLAATPSSPDPSEAAQLRPDGPIGRQAAALRRADGVPLTIVPGPETLQTWDALAVQDPQFADGVAAVRQALGTDQMVAGPYVPLDLPSLLRAGMTAAVDAEMLAGDDALRGFFRTRLDPRTALGRPIDTAALTRLRAGGVDRVIVEGGAVATTRTSRYTVAQPFKLAAPPSFVPGGLVSAIGADTDLARLLNGSEPPAVRAQRLLAGLALVAFERPTVSRAVAIVNPPDFAPPAALLDAVLSGLRGNPLLRPMTVDQVFEQIPAETASDRSAVTRDLASYIPPAPPVSAELFNAKQFRLTAFRGLAPTSPNVVVGQRSLLASIASAWNAPGGGDRARAELTAVDGAIDGFLARIHVPNRSTITLTDRSGDIPLTFRNDTGQPVNVLVQLQSPKLSFPDGAERIVSLPPKNTTVRFAVEARTSGSFPLQLTLRSADGALTIAQAGFQIEANAVSAVGLALIISAAVFLALWWIFHIRRERRRRLVGVESE